MNNTIGGRIKYLRVSKELSIRQLALRCNISPSYISFIETGKKHPTRDALEKIASGLSVDIAYLAGEETPTDNYSWFTSLPSYIQDFLRCQDSVSYLHVIAIAKRSGLSARELMKWVLPIDHLQRSNNEDSSFGRTLELMFNIYKEHLLGESE